jgi:hypothetical protein
MVGEGMMLDHTTILEVTRDVREPDLNEETNTLRVPPELEQIARLLILDAGHTQWKALRQLVQGVGDVSRVVGEETVTIDLKAIKQRFENAERDDLREDLAPSDMADLIAEVETMRRFNSLLIGEAGIWIPCVDCPDRQASRYFSKE